MASKSAAAPSAPECSISLEKFTEEGPNRPVMLPMCGHTFSRASVEELFHFHEAGVTQPIECPTCQAVQHNLSCAGDAPPNWEIIRTLWESAQGPMPSAPPLQRETSPHSTVPSAPPLPREASSLAKGKLGQLPNSESAAIAPAPPEAPPRRAVRELRSYPLQISATEEDEEFVSPKVTAAYGTPRRNTRRSTRRNTRKAGAAGSSSRPAPITRNPPTKEASTSRSAAPPLRAVGAPFQDQESFMQELCGGGISGSSSVAVHASIGTSSSITIGNGTIVTEDEIIGNGMIVTKDDIIGNGMIMTKDVIMGNGMVIPTGGIIGNGMAIHNGRKKTVRKLRKIKGSK